MTATAPQSANATPDEITGRIFSSLIDAMEIFCVYVGDRLGFYRALHEGGPATARSWRLVPGRTSATPASGWSNRPPRATWPLTTPRLRR